MGFEAKRNTLLPSWKSKKMWRSNYAPPLLHLAWKAGLKIPPLPFASFWQITLLMGGWFGPAWGSVCGFYLEGYRDTTGHCICLKRRRRYLFWCSYGCVSLVAKGR